METYQVNILALTNAEGAFNKLGEGTLIIDDLRDEVRITGLRVAGWVKSVLIVAFIICLCVPMPTTLFMPTDDIESLKTGVTIGWVLKVALLLGVIALAIFRKSIFPMQELAVRFTQAELGLVGRGVDEVAVEGSVMISSTADDSGSIKKWASVLPLTETDAQAIVDAVNKLRDG